MYGYGPASPPLTNNPFISDPNHPSTRFPDISSTSTSPSLQYTQQWLSNNSSPTGYPAQGSFQQQPQLGALNDSYSSNLGGGGYFSPVTQSVPQFGTSPTVPFQPTSSFGQHLAANISGSSYNYLSGQPTGYPQQQQLGPAQQQIQSNPGYVAQLDPYGPLAQWDGTGQQQQQQYQQPQYQNGFTSESHINTPLPTSAVSPTGDPHPREYIRSHKAEIESWDNFAWKQLLNAFELLKRAWESRKTEIGKQVEQLKVQLNYAGYYQQQVQAEIMRAQRLYKEAESHFDSVAASTFQIQEVFHGYRQSGDLASKRRVREATNAALQSLPDWPAPGI